jgi:SAM-dependent methyltransferase
MPRAGEYTYFARIGEDGRQHSINKPFSDEGCARFFMDLGLLYLLLPKPPARVLECGCGTGWLSFFLARRGYQVVGQDCAEDAIELARQNPMFVKTGQVEFVCSDFEDLDYRDEFDAIVFYAALHHTQKEQATFDSAWRALKPGGILVAMEPGVGQEKRSQRVIQEYDVGDRDMPPVLAIRCGKQAGFREFRIYQHAGQLVSALYDEPPSSQLLRKLWRIPGLKLLAFLASYLYLKRYNGTVWMRK